MPAAKVVRETFLEKLEMVRPGLASREVAEQATCFAFKNGRVYTFNEEIACHVESSLPADFQGAVQSRPLLDILQNMPDKMLNVSNGAGKLVLESVSKKGNKDGKPDRRARIIMQKEVLLPFDQVEQPEKWSKLSEDFGEAVRICTNVVQKESSDWMFTVVHLHPDFMEASDGDQAIRYKGQTGLKKPVLIRGRSLKHVADMQVYKFAQTSKWIHFKTREGAIFSCKQYAEKYELTTAVDAMLKERGKPTELPSALEKAAKAAKVFSSESDDKKLRIRLSPNGRMYVIGTGVSGDYYEKKAIKYKGDKAVFIIKPDLLEEVAKSYNEVEITNPTPHGNRRMRIDSGKWTGVVSLQRDMSSVDPGDN